MDRELYEDFLELVDDEPLMFPDKSVIDKDYVECCMIYQEIFEKQFIQKTGLERLEKRIIEKGYLPETEQKRDFFQRLSSKQSEFFFLRNLARIDRLNEDERKIIQAYISSRNDDKYKEVYRLVFDTYKSVMAADPENPDTYYIMKDTINGEYKIKGNGMAIVLKSIPEFDSSGNYVDEEKEMNRINNIVSIKNQLVPILSDAMDMPVEIILEL